jgi:hypothetical protein
MGAENPNYNRHIHTTPLDVFVFGLKDTATYV